jgi:hypothetical protein
LRITPVACFIASCAAENNLLRFNVGWESDQFGFAFPVGWRL